MFFPEIILMFCKAEQHTSKPLSCQQSDGLAMKRGNSSPTFSI
ncbi:hypothetical protein IMCC1989_191 [gamma proteobacterium IMCC1989]|nr:hypothetical protein IMCC1989_191 [gamma proteobacterium IMCC1989]